MSVIWGWQQKRKSDYSGDTVSYSQLLSKATTCSNLGKVIALQALSTVPLFLSVPFHWAFLLCFALF